MREISSDITFEVAANRTASVRVARSTRLTVRCGTVWVTRSDDTADYWLEPGHTLRLRRGERLWIGAEGGAPAWVAFAAPSRLGERVIDWGARAARGRPHRRRLADRLTCLVRSIAQAGAFDKRRRQGRSPSPLPSPSCAACPARSSRIR